MSCSENTNASADDPLETLDDAVAAAAFRRLVRHLRHRHDAQNIELMGLAGFCRNCLADWIRDAGDSAAAGFDGRELAEERSRPLRALQPIHPLTGVARWPMPPTIACAC